MCFESNKNILKDCNIFIITVPTPVDKNNLPDLRNLLSASKTVAGFLKKNDIVIYESTVYPGTTENICIPLIEKLTSLKSNKDFFTDIHQKELILVTKIRALKK